MLHFNQNKEDDRYWTVVVHPIASPTVQVASIFKPYRDLKSVMVTPDGRMMTLSALLHLGKGAKMIANNHPDTREGYFSLGKGIGKGYTHD